MKIGIIAPPWIPIPPPRYGGIELVVYNLAEGLTAIGEEVILFAPRESKVSCRLLPYLDNPMYFGLDSSDTEKAFVGEISAKYAYAMCGYEGVDIIHDHTLSRPLVDIPVVHTLHGPAAEGSIRRCVELSQDPRNHFISISDRQQELYHTLNSTINFAATVHNSVDVNKIEWTAKKEDFFLFVGRSNWEKGLDLAIRVATKANIPLVMAVKMTEQFEQDFFTKEIQPWIDRYPKHLPFQFHGEIPRPLLFDLFKRARCTLFTSQWEEPFGLVMIESMACGTPVIALRRGAAPEVIIDGKTGYLVDSEEGMIAVTKKIDKIKPKNCRKHVEDNFSYEKMAREYLAAYHNILSKTKTPLVEAKI